MSRIKIPTREEILQLAEVRADICVSIYMETSPLKLHADTCRIELRNHIKEAFSILEKTGHDKRRLATLKATLDDIVGDEEAFCQYQYNSLALLATPDFVRVYRLVNQLSSQVSVADRFYLKPLLRALTFRHTAYVLALSENKVRVVELHPDSDPEEVRIPDIPKDASHALGMSSMNVGKGSPLEGQDDRKSRLARYARKVDDVLRPLTSHCEHPLILVATEPLAAIYRSVSSACLVADTITTNPDTLSVKELAEMARPALDAHYREDMAAIHRRFEERAGQHRVTTDIVDAARAATYGMVSLALVDFEVTGTGYIDQDGMVTFSRDPEAYGLIDEIAKRTLENGGRVLAVRQEDMIGETGLAAILRYPLNA